MAYTKRYAGGFVNKPTLTTPIDSTFLNAVETALLALLTVDGTVDGQVLQWVNASTRFGPALLLNKNVDAAAAIDWTKLDTAGKVVNASVGGAAAIARSKLDFGSGLANADIAAAAAIVASKLANYPADVSKSLRGDGTWVVGGQALLYDSGFLGSTAASFDVSAISGSYSQLLLRWLGRSDTAAANTTVKLVINNDTAANYYFQRLSGQAATASAAETLAGTAHGQVGDISAATATANQPGQGDVYLHGYAGTTFKKLFTSRSVFWQNNSTNGINIGLWAGGWNNTAAITRVTLTPGAGNWIAGSRFQIYGVL